MLKRITMPGFTELDRQIAKLRELRDSFRAANESRSYLPKDSLDFPPPATES
ncbi:hypothetical protein [Geobacter sp.]|uniref:hypothetical protein n=1 Tax=Geobacter sp. TaxID=46610 RepID=UPI001AC20531|nr:hypothetical protein [Geobacter sp.]CAG0993080.1 hypothetical protein PLCT2_02582 [Planctomycetaceae bacterium]